MASDGRRQCVRIWRESLPWPFLRDACIVTPGATVPCKVLYDHWRAWCEQQGRDHPGTMQAFGNDLHSAVPGLGIRQVGTGTERWRAYNGIRLRHSGDDAKAAA